MELSPCDEVPITMQMTLLCRPHDVQKIARSSPDRRIATLKSEAEAAQRCFGITN